MDDAGIWLIDNLLGESHSGYSFSFITSLFSVVHSNEPKMAYLTKCRGHFTQNRRRPTSNNCNKENKNRNNEHNSNTIELKRKNVSIHSNTFGIYQLIGIVFIPAL